ncbi:hypothetical protein DPEC_G00182160 [Dallia pectoralis]|uniref:Uncharacterized protein n=1 Tax=Dallia pectoralis TaxID=75939 RepID=A0ACC2GAV0_DALPE|nr:hypothetical protein DPEC_G00182160 [Dallia pectoralis]
MRRRERSLRHQREMRKPEKECYLSGTRIWPHGSDACESGRSSGISPPIKRTRRTGATRRTGKPVVLRASPPTGPEKKNVIDNDPTEEKKDQQPIL